MLHGDGEEMCLIAGGMLRDNNRGCSIAHWYV